MKSVTEIIGIIQISFFSIVTSLLCEFDILSKQLYTHHPVITLFTDYSCYCLVYIHSILNQYYIEPYKKEWICSANIELFQGSYILCECFYFYTKYDLKQDEVLNYYLETSNETIENKNNVSLFMVNYPETTCIRNKVNQEMYEDTTILKSPFLTITYKNKNVDNIIDIIIPKKYLVKNNEILGPCFIFRYLKYQPIYFIFNMDYEIEIMDKDLNTFVLKSDEYIILKENGYEKVNINEKLKLKN